MLNGNRNPVPAIPGAGPGPCGWRKPHLGVCWVLNDRVRHLFVAAIGQPTSSKANVLTTNRTNCPAADVLVNSSPSSMRIVVAYRLLYNREPRLTTGLVPPENSI